MRHTSFLVSPFLLPLLSELLLINQQNFEGFLTLWSFNSFTCYFYSKGNAHIHKLCAYINVFVFVYFYVCMSVRRSGYLFGDPNRFFDQFRTNSNLAWRYGFSAMVL